MATTVGDRLLVDTSVLLEASNRARAQHKAALRLIEDHEALVFPAQVPREFLMVATRPAGANGLGLTVRQALESLRAFRTRIRLLPEERPLLPRLLQLVEETGVASKRIHDAHIVTAAVVHRVRRIVTLNLDDFRGFDRYVTCTDPERAR
jgi:predicted nucleic acid-binding protein